MDARPNRSELVMHAMENEGKSPDCSPTVNSSLTFYAETPTGQLGPALLLVTRIIDEERATSSGSWIV